MKPLIVLFSVLTFAATLPAAGADAPKAPDLMPVTQLETPEHDPVDIVRDKRARAVIYVADPDPNEKLKTLVDELVEVIKLSTGAEIPIVKTRPRRRQPAIVIGDCKQAREAGIKAGKLPPEGFVVKTAKNRIYLVGSTAKVPLNNSTGPFVTDGTAWAVADFLERFVGVRWYWPADVGGRTIVKTTDLTVPPAHYSDAPVFRKRTHHPEVYWLPASISLPKASDSRQLLSYLHSSAKPKKVDMSRVLTCLRNGNSLPCNIRVHQPQGVPHRSEEWIKKHGPLGAAYSDGTLSPSLMCYTAQATYDLFIQAAEQLWDEHKSGQNWISDLCFNVSPGDEPVICYCVECNRLLNPPAEARHGQPGGQASRIMGTFVKRLCDETKRRWPGKKVMYLPYWNYALCPEGIDFPGNLVVEICTSGFPLFRQASVREPLEKNLRAWSRKVGGKITTWEYSCWVTHWTRAPIQYPHLLQDYYRTNREILAGSFINGGAFDEWGRTAPSLYCWMRVLWNPDVDIEATLDEMCKRLYRKGAEPSRELLRLMCDRWENTPWSEDAYSAGGSQLPATIFSETWPPEVTDRMEQLWRQAREEMKDDPVALQRFGYWNWTFEAFLREARAVARKRKTSPHPGVSP